MRKNRNAKVTELSSIPLEFDRDMSRRDYMRDSLKCYTLPPDELKALNDRLGPRPTKKHHSKIIPVHQRGGAA